MNRLPRIPSPPSHYWNQFRQRILPIIVFAAALYAAYQLWNKTVAPTGMVGEVEMIRSTVTTSTAGTIADLNVDIFQRVQKGDPICTIITYDPETTKAMLLSLIADLQIMKTRMVTDQGRNVSSYIQLQLNLLEHRVRLASERVNLEYAKSEFERAYKLYQAETDTEFQVNYWRSQRDMYQANVDQLTKLIADLEQSLKQLEPLAITELETSINKNIAEAIAAKQAELEALQKPTVLKAPIDGVISFIHKHSGEKVVPGDMIVTISGLGSSRILGFVRQPLNVKPKVGDKVEVRTRTQDRAIGIGTVLSVGTQLEPVTASLIPYLTGATIIGRGPDNQNIVEYGLPFLVSLPPNLKLVPGEVVNLSLVKER